MFLRVACSRCSKIWRTQPGWLMSARKNPQTILILPGATASPQQTVRRGLIITSDSLGRKDRNQRDEIKKKKNYIKTSFCALLCQRAAARVIIWLCKHTFRNAWSDVLYDVLSLKELALLSGSARKTGNSKKRCKQVVAAQPVSSAHRCQRAEMSIQRLLLVLQRWSLGISWSYVFVFVLCFHFLCLQLHFHVLLLEFYFDVNFISNCRCMRA